MYKKSFTKDNILIIEVVILIVVLVFGIFGIFGICTVCGKIGSIADSKNRPVLSAIDTSAFVDKGTKNNIDLVTWAENAYKQDWGYVYGTWGNELTDSLLLEKCEQYPTDVGENKDFIRDNYQGRRVTDCVGLIKGYCWYSDDSGFVYCSNGMPDMGANRLFEEATEMGEIGTIPEIKGIAVWAKGHIGVYIGDGWVIEAMSTLDGIKKTRIEDRPWTHWCKIPYIEYAE